MKSGDKIWIDFKKGEKSALSTIYHQYIQKLFRYGKKFTADDEMIKDVIQDLFFDLINSRDSLGETDNVYFYLLASLRRRIARAMNRNHTFMHVSEEETNSEVVFSAEQDIISVEDTSYREKRIKEALAELSPRQREILYYKFTCDFNYEQICEIMDLQYDSARKQVHRALKSMKEKLFDSDAYILFAYFF